MSPIENLQARLERMQPAFEAAPDTPPSLFDPPPDGDYQTLLHEFDFFEGGQPKQAFLKMRFQVVHNEEYAGRFCETVYPLEDEERIGYLKRDLKTLGADMDSFRLVDCVPDSPFLIGLLDTPTLIRVKTGSKINEKTGKPYVSVYIEQKIGDAPQRRSARDMARREDLPERTGQSDVPDDTSDFEATRKAEQEAARDAKYGETIPEGTDEERTAELVAAGCECEDPLAVEAQPGTGSIECPIPGHAQF